MDQTLVTKSSKKVCVTGGTGNLASILIKHLLQSGYKVNTTVRDPGSSLPSSSSLKGFKFFNGCYCGIAENEKRISHLKPLQELGDLKIFKADLTEEESFDAAILGCDYVFHVATPVNFTSKDPEVWLINRFVQDYTQLVNICIIIFVLINLQKDLIKPAVQGVINVLQSCVKSKSVKRVIYTSSAAAVTINNLSGSGFVLDERNWTDIDFVRDQKPLNWVIT